MPFYTDDDLIINPSPRCACVLVLDTSSSMLGSAIKQLNQGINSFLYSLKLNDNAAYSIELGVISYGQNVQLINEPTPAYMIDSLPILEAVGKSPLGAAVEMALDTVNKRIKIYKENGLSYYKPWIVIMSDGIPTDDWQDVAVKISNMSNKKELVVMPIMINALYEGMEHLNILSRFSNKSALNINNAQFDKFFNWLSLSMSIISTSVDITDGRIKLPSTSEFATNPISKSDWDFI